LHTKDDVVLQAPTAHNHAPKHGKAAVDTVRSQMKQRAEQTEEGTRQIVHQSLTQVSVQHAHLLPSRATLSRDVCRHRQKNGLNDHQMELYVKTIGGEDFLCLQEDDMLVFAAQSDVDYLVNNEHWFADGTFRVTPEGFDQLYTIHTLKNGVSYPCI
jgi:hypothetical protein